MFKPQNLITEPTEIRQAISQLTTYQQLWLDTEIADWRTPNPRLSLIQASTDTTDKTGNSVYILDVLDKSDLITEFIDRIMVNPNIGKVFHHAQFDLKYLGKEQAKNVTCTLKLAKKITKSRLGTSNFKLKTLARELCNFENVHKEQQGSNWGQRPLSKEQLDYAKMDVVYLVSVHQCLLKFIASEQQNLEPYQANTRQNDSYNNLFNATQLRVAFDCPRLFYLNYCFHSNTLFSSGNAINGIGTIFHKQAKEFINFAKTEPQIPTLFNLPAAQLERETIASQMRKLFYQAHFFPYLQTNIDRNQNKAPQLYQVWLGLTNLIKQWTKLLISNRNYYNAGELIERTFIKQEESLEHTFTLPDNSQQTLRGTFDCLVYHAARGRLCIIDYKTYDPIDPSSQLIQIAVYSYILWNKEKKISDCAVYCVSPKFKAYYYPWEQLEDTVHQLISHKLEEMTQWVNWEQGNPNPPPPTTSRNLCSICPQQEKCQTFFSN